MQCYSHVAVTFHANNGSSQDEKVKKRRSLGDAVLSKMGQPIPLSKEEKRSIRATTAAMKEKATLAKQTQLEKWMLMLPSATSSAMTTMIENKIRVQASVWLNCCPVLSL